MQIVTAAALLLAALAGMLPCMATTVTLATRVYQAKAENEAGVKDYSV